MSKISIIVPVYNGSNDLPHLLTALANQTIDPDSVEYLIVDNGSTDATKDIILEFSKGAKVNLRYISEHDIKGSYAARNKGIRSSSGKILVFTDADCIPERDWVENLVSGLENNEMGAMAGAIHGVIGGNLLEQYANRFGVLSQDHTFKHPYMPYGQTANLAIRREVFEKIGMFRPHVNSGGDADICWRMQAETDYKLGYNDSAVVFHQHRTSWFNLFEQYERYGRSSIYLSQLHGYKTARKPRIYFYIRKIIVWAAYKFPQLFYKYSKGKISKLDVYQEPIKLFIMWSNGVGASRALKKGPLKNIEVEYF